MISLFIDTSSKNIIVAVIKNKDILSLIMEANDNTLSERIFPLLIKAMNEANKDIKAIEKVYVVNGPGSFTGVRVGVTIAKTIAWSLNIPLIPISSLEVLASTQYDSDYLIPYIDARRGYVYAGIYDNNLNNIVEDQHIELSEIINKMPKKGKFCFVGYDKIETNLNIIDPQINLLRIINKHYNDVGVNPHTLVPNYLKLTEAEENLKKETV
ncbi:MAG: tRNA (adenosine(37)-N6)-threonylcarbamoyltransferase complex dimerization subunit type 1 TsaB [Mollicutes bacterium]|jgi:tRNA threonylcarbamoyladenosine biosynthesis protein TsaB|nr:tRNA (adenosine(37)-N6)-threonylcarbamoyltransferase complex dimerization subunit type 1 TsaB [Mollicutes bacterium]